VVERGDAVAQRAFANLGNVVMVEPDHLTTYLVLWSDTLVFTTETVEMVGRSPQRYEVTETDFVKESVTVPAAPAADEPVVDDEGAEE
jgi:hypothetical protein